MRHFAHDPRRSHAGLGAGPGSRPNSGAGLLVAATLAAAASLGLIFPTARAIYCDRLAPLAVLAVLSASLLALGFRALAGGGRRALLGAALLLAAASLFGLARFLAHYSKACSEVQRQFHSLHAGV